MKKLILTSIASIAFVGCVSQPSSKFDLQYGNQHVTFQSPKDYNVSGLHMVVETNGTASIDITTLQSNVSSNLVSDTKQQLEGINDIVNSVGGQLNAAFQSAAGVAAKVATAPK